MHRCTLLGLSLLFGVCVSGCGSSKTTKVEVLVTLDGKPLSGATVRFVPQGGSAGHPASGLTGSDGRCHLQTFVPGDGAEAGTYDVLITKTETQTGAVVAQGNPDEMKKSMLDQMMKVSKPQPKKAAEVPALYGTVGKSGLFCTVPPTSSPVKFELRSQGGT